MHFTLSKKKKKGIDSEGERREEMWGIHNWICLKIKNQIKWEDKNSDNPLRKSKAHNWGPSLQRSDVSVVDLGSKRIKVSSLSKTGRGLKLCDFQNSWGIKRYVCVGILEKQQAKHQYLEKNTGNILRESAMPKAKLGRNKRKNTRKAGISDKALKCLYLSEQSGQMMKELEPLAWDWSPSLKVTEKEKAINQAKNTGD